MSGYKRREGSESPQNISQEQNKRQRFERLLWIERHRQKWSGSRAPGQPGKGEKSRKPWTVVIDYQSTNLGNREKLQCGHLGDRYQGTTEAELQQARAELGVTGPDKNGERRELLQRRCCRQCSAEVMGCPFWEQLELGFWENITQDAVKGITQDVQIDKQIDNE